MMEKIKKALSGNIPTGPDNVNGGDGLPDWMQFTITVGMFVGLFWVLYLLFHPTLTLDDTHRDLLNIIFLLILFLSASKPEINNFTKANNETPQYNV